MPNIRPQHLSWKDTEHVEQLRKDWPEDCTVQWGGGGIVLGGKDGARRTAFFEAFPAGGGFIRGEGKTIKEAEEAAFNRFVKEAACQHVWGRRGYTNGGCKCLSCGAFQTIMKPITVLGGYRKPISSIELEIAINGWLAPTNSSQDEPKDAQRRRRTFLRLRMAGIDLPEPPLEPEDPVSDEMFARTPYAEICRDRIFEFFEKNGGLEFVEGKGDMNSLSGLFDSLSFGMVKWEYKEWLEEREGADTEVSSPSP